MTKIQAAKDALVERLRKLFGVDKETTVNVYYWDKSIPLRIAEISISKLDSQGFGGGSSIMQSDSTDALLRAERWLLTRIYMADDEDEVQREDEMLQYAIAEEPLLKNSIWSKGIQVLEGWIDQLNQNGDPENLRYLKIALTCLEAVQSRLRNAETSKE